MIPTGPGRLTTLRRHALCTGLLDLLVLFRNERDRPDGARSEPHLAAFRIKAEGAVKALEAELPEIAKTPFDVAQVTLGCCLDYLAFRFAADDWWQGLPNLGAWHETFKARPSVKAFPIVDA
jgi:glutathione S-transferase